MVHGCINPNPDLTMFGEGLQRIFKIGLLFAGAKNGVVIIDEFENAIHASLLSNVVVLLHELAIQFNAQVFISSHSKECIDAFALCENIPKSDCMNLRFNSMPRFSSARTAKSVLTLLLSVRIFPNPNCRPIVW